MADSLVALLIVALGINLIYGCERQLVRQQRNEQVKLMAARLGKEASDQYAITRKRAVINRQAMHAQADHNGVEVNYRGRLILQVAP